MTVMVDPLAVYPNAWGPFLAGSCHMVTDGPLEELHTFAVQLGLKREWFQDDKKLPHYDLTKGKRFQAVRLGAVEVSYKEMFDRVEGVRCCWCGLRHPGGPENCPKTTRLHIAVVGSQGYPRLDFVQRFVFSTPEDAVIVSGGAPGVDTVAEESARDSAREMLCFPAQWEQYGNRAGPLRNSEIVEAAHQVWAFWDGGSPGTHDAITKAMADGKLYGVFGPDGRRMTPQEILQRPSTRATTTDPASDVCTNYHRGKDTSVEAYTSTCPEARHYIRRQVLEHVRAQGARGATSDEMEAALGLPHQTVSARLTELKVEGSVVESGRKRKTRAGRAAHVLVARET